MNGSSESLVRAIRGPITLITIGVLFALNNFTQYRFDQTWPVILIVFGLLSLMRRAVPCTSFEMPGVQPYYPPQGGPTGSYRQSPYPGPVPPPAPTSPVKGGFGTSAPQRASEAAPAPPPPTGDSI